MVFVQDLAYLRVMAAQVYSGVLWCLVYWFDDGSIYSLLILSSNSFWFNLDCDASIPLFNFITWILVDSIWNVVHLLIYIRIGWSMMEARHTMGRALALLVKICLSCFQTTCLLGLRLHFDFNFNSAASCMFLLCVLGFGWWRLLSIPILMRWALASVVPVI